MASSSVCTPPTNIQEPESAWLYASGSWIDIMGGSGSNPNPDKDLRSDSRSPFKDPRQGTPQHILVVEDNEADVFLIEEAIAAAGLPLAVHIARNGDEAIEFFDRADSVQDAPCPVLILLDINLPRRSGYDVLKHMRRSRRCASAHVIAVSTSDSQTDRRKMAELGTDSYFRKPSEYADFMKLGDVVKTVLARHS